MAVNMEKKKKGEQFRVLDFAKLPEKPVSPNLKKFFFLSLASGLCLGFGIVLLLDFMDSTVRRTDELEMAGIPVLATMPQLYSHRRNRWLRVKTAMTACGVTAAMGLTAVFAYLAV
jgi:capsular polysaccharide biosynthesis protein